MPHLSTLISLGFTAERFPAGTHMCYIYNDDDEREKLISQFLESGLLAGEKVGYLAATASPMPQALADAGIGAAANVKPGQFKVSPANDIYCPDHHFVPDRMLDFLCGSYTRSIAEGYAGSRVSGEMEWSRQSIPGSERLIDFESRINTISAEYPITPICQCDARKFDGATLFKVLKVHPMMIVRGQVVHNPYHIPPEHYPECTGHGH